jgi:hypothetical protein
MHIEDRGLISDSRLRPAGQRASAFVGLARTRQGTLFCTFQNGPKKHAATSTVRICRSRDGGHSWQELPFLLPTTFAGIPGSLGCGEIVEVSPGRLLLIATWMDRREPDRPLFDPVSSGILHCRQLAAWSEDEGETWGPWRELPTPGLGGCTSTGPILQWPDGTLAYPLESYKTWDDPRVVHHAARVMVSRDRGLTFSEPLLLAQHPEHQLYYWDQRLCVGAHPGEWIGLFWTHDLAAQRDLTVHRASGSITAAGFRTDTVTATSLAGQIAAPLLLADGQLLAFVVDREHPGQLTLWRSPDHGQTWADKLVVYVHDERATLSQGREHIDFGQYWDDMNKWSFGHPALRDLGDGRVLLAHYAGPPDEMSVHWIRVDVRS